MKIIKSIILGLLLTILISSLGFAQGGSRTPSGILISDLEKEIDEYAKQYIGTKVPGASVVVIKDGEIVFSKGYGYSDVMNKKPVISDKTVFEWGSITKLFTWVSVMQLEEIGLVDRNTDIKTFLSPELRDGLKYKESITLQNIMNHTSGFGEYAFDLIYDSPEKVISLESILLKSHPKQYLNVGEASVYSNYATGLAGAVIENISEQPYHAYVKEHILTPLNMNDTTADPTFQNDQSVIRNKAKTYKLSSNTKFEEEIWSYISMSPAGSLNGTAEDLSLFAIALLDRANNLFGEEETLNKLFTESYQDTANGFFIYDGVYKSYGHGGNTAGSTSQFAIVPEASFAVVTLTNIGSEVELAYGIQKLLIGTKSIEIESESKSLPSSKIVEGDYLTYRRCEGSFLNVLSYLTPLNVKSVDENKIEISVFGMNGTYRQIAPFEYKLEQSKSPIFDVGFSKFKFEVVSDKVEKIIVGHGSDYAPIPKHKSKIVQLVSLIIVFLGALVWTISLAVIIKRMIKNKERYNNMKYPLTILIINVIGLWLLSNNGVSLMSFITDSFKTYLEILPHIIINYLNMACSLILCVFISKKIKIRKLDRKHFVNLVIQLSLLFALHGVLIHWNFYNF